MKKENMLHILLLLPCVISTAEAKVLPKGRVHTHVPIGRVDVRFTSVVRLCLREGCPELGVRVWRGLILEVTSVILAVLLMILQIWRWLSDCANGKCCEYQGELEQGRERDETEGREPVRIWIEVPKPKL